ncbi:hypothetical protein LZ31DRAFT_541521 [Colletotrichum somersetense]|nr:hypothetical protein LZ31DRAFT_541521 [Colletotrichum somersetense]
MHYINKIIHVCVAFQVAFQVASGAILRGRTISADSVQLPASNLDSLSLAAEDLDNQLESFLRSWGGGHRKPDIVEITNIAKRQTGSIQISSEELQDLLRLIQSIAQQLSAIIESGGSSASGTVTPPTSNTVSNTAPVSSASEIAVPPVSNTVSNTGPVSSSPAPSDVQSTDTGTNPAATGEQHTPSTHNPPLQPAHFLHLLHPRLPHVFTYPGSSLTMGSIDSTPFPVLDDPHPEDNSLPAFMVSTTRGFLPRADPVAVLPPEFAPLEDILSRMPVKKLDGTPGLLASSKLGETVDAEFPDLTHAIDQYKDNLPLMNALYRDYSFLASAYLLEPCHERFVRGEGYGLARDRLPRKISMPIARCAELTGFKPWMEYAGSYALYNYRLEDPSKGLEYSNVRLIRAFEKGLDPTSSEAGFVLVHIAMVKHTGGLVKGTMDALRSSASPGSPLDRAALNRGLSEVLAALRTINNTMETMWDKSRPQSYTSFRTFIFGITSQSMFPNGVVYEGVNGDEPMSFRGESGANDSIVPLMDNLLQVPMPDTPLTEILKDFRSYRPSNHRQFLMHVKDRSLEVGLKDAALAAKLPTDGLAEGEREAVRESRRLWLLILHQVRDFRWRHWCFAREYILKRTSHPTATGGSPIVTWLPNQLEAVLVEMEGLYEAVGGGAGGDWDLGEELRDVMDLVSRQKHTLRKEVAKYCAERGVNTHTSSS